MLALCYTPLSQETGGIKMNYYLLGFCVGVVIALVILAFAKKSRGEFDERQVLVRGKAYQIGFFTSLGAGAVYGIASALLKRQLAEDSVAVFFVLLVGVGAFVVNCIMNDAFFAVSEKMKPALLVIVIVVSIIAQSFTIADNIIDGTLLREDGVISSSAMPIVSCAFFIAVLAALAIKLIKSRKESDDE